MIVSAHDHDLVTHLLDARFRRHWLADGDSWFSIGGATSNLLMALDDDDTLIVNCAYPGDTLRDMSSIGNEAFVNLLRPHFGVPWDGVLLSAGGNDLLGDVGKLIDGGNLSRDGMRIALDGIASGYRRMVRTVRQYQDCAIHAHTYDYPIPDTRGGLFRIGPWIGNRLLAAGVEPHRHDGIVTDIIDMMASTIMAVDGLTVHDTRGTLPPGRWKWWGWQEWWRNEMHPSRAGYARLAARWRI